MWGFSRFAVILKFKSYVSGRRNCVRTSTFANESKFSGPNKNGKVGLLISLRASSLDILTGCFGGGPHGSMSI